MTCPSRQEPTPATRRPASSSEAPVTVAEIEAHASVLRHAPRFC